MNVVIQFGKIMFPLQYKVRVF